MAEKQKKMKAASGKDRDTKLLEAAKKSKRSDIISHLQKGANINALDETSGFTALHLAVEQGSDECVNTLLMNGSDVKNVTLDGRGVLHIATITGNEKMIQLLLNKVSNIVQLINCQDETGSTPLHIAFKNNNSDIASSLYSCEGCSMTLVDNDGCLPLHYGASSGMTKDIDKLIKLGSDPNLQDKQGRTPLHHAALTGSSGAALALFRHAVDANVLDNNKQTAAILAEKSGHSALAEVLKQKSQQNKGESGTSTETTDSSSKAHPLPTHSRKPPPLPSSLPPEPEEIDEFRASDVGLAPPDVPVPPMFVPKAAEIEDLVEDDEDTATDNTGTDSIIEEEEVQDDKPSPRPHPSSLPPPPSVLPPPQPVRGSLPPPPLPNPSFIPPPLPSPHSGSPLPLPAPSPGRASPSTSPPSSSSSNTGSSLPVPLSH